MEALAPIHGFILYILDQLISGNSLRNGISRYLESHTSDFSKDVRNWYITHEINPEKNKRDQISIYREALFEILHHGLNGQSIIKPLEELEKEISQWVDDRIELHYKLLPTKLYFPLILTTVPAFFLLYIGPLITSLIKALNQ